MSRVSCLRDEVNSEGYLDHRTQTHLRSAITSSAMHSTHVAQQKTQRKTSHPTFEKAGVFLALEYGRPDDSIPKGEIVGRHGTRQRM